MGIRTDLIHDDEKELLMHLRRDARQKINHLSPIIDIPKSTLFERLKSLEEKFVHKHTTLVNFEEMGYKSRNIHIVKAEQNKKELLKDYLTSHPNVNNLLETNSGTDFLIETIFRNQKETNDFVEELLSNTKHHQTLNIIQDIKREDFMSK